LDDVYNNQMDYSRRNSIYQDLQKFTFDLKHFLELLPTFDIQHIQTMYELTHRKKLHDDIRYIFLDINLLYFNHLLYIKKVISDINVMYLIMLRMILGQIIYTQIIIEYDNFSLSETQIGHQTLVSYPSLVTFIN